MRCSGVVAATMTAAGVSRGKPAARQRGDDVLDVAHRHVDDDRLPGSRQRRPVEIARRHGRWRR